MERVAREGRGVVIILSSSVPTARVVESYLENLFDQGIPSHPDSQAPNMEVGVGAQILRDLGVHKMRLMGAPVKYTGLAGFDLEVTETLSPDDQ